MALLTQDRCCSRGTGWPSDDSWVRIPPKKFIKVGRIDPLDYDQDWRFTEWDLLDYKEVVFFPRRLDRAIATALTWIEEEVEGTRE